MITKDADLTLESWFAGDTDHRLLLNREDAYVRNNHIKYHHGSVLEDKPKNRVQLVDLMFLVLSKHSHPNVQRILGEDENREYDWVEKHVDILDSAPESLPNYGYGYVLHNVIYSECECCGGEMHLLNNSTGYSICDRCNVRLHLKPLEL
jgi:hypothetical protein